MRNQYRKLLKDQKSRGVIFSSQLKDSKGKVANAGIHEVFADDSEKELKIERLTDASFFKDGSWDINEIRE